MRKSLQKVWGESQGDGKDRLNVDACDSLGLADEAVVGPCHHTPVPGTDSVHNSVEAMADS